MSTARLLLISAFGCLAVAALLALATIFDSDLLRLGALVPLAGVGIAQLVWKWGDDLRYLVASLVAIGVVILGAALLERFAG